MRGRQTDAPPVAGLLDSSDPGHGASDVAAVAPHADMPLVPMQLVLVLPGLLDPRNAGEAPIRAPGLAALLALAAPPARNADGLDAAIASYYGIERQADWPLAAIRAAALGLPADDAYWLAADPVTLVVGRDDVAFAGIVDDLTRADADALIASLNAHFTDDGITFVAPRPDAIFARLATAPRVTTHPPTAIPDQPLRIRLPDGPDAAAWRRWQSEIQMLLHEHPVNLEREKSGRSPANSVWFSSGGMLPPRPAPGAPICTFANAGIAVALAAHGGTPARPLPANLDAALDGSLSAACIVVALAAEVGLTDIERSWADPARDALVAGRLGAVSILAHDAGDAVIWHASRPRLGQRIAGRFRRHDVAAEIAAARRT